MGRLTCTCIEQKALKSKGSHLIGWQLIYSNNSSYFNRTLPLFYTDGVSPKLGYRKRAMPMIFVFTCPVMLLSQICFLRILKTHCPVKIMLTEQRKHSVDLTSRGRIINKKDLRQIIYGICTNKNTSGILKLSGTLYCKNYQRND